jgi:hypothetical protein
MARRSTGLQFAIHFRVRQNGLGPAVGEVRSAYTFKIISGFGDLGPALTNLGIVRLLRFGRRQRNRSLIVFAEAAHLGSTQMNLQMKREALTKLNRPANEGGLSFGTVQPN